MRIGLAIVTIAGLMSGQSITKVEPDTAKAGDTLSVTGTQMDAEAVGDLYLTDGTTDVLLKMDEQTATNIKVKVPATVKAGRWSLMFRTKKGQLVEQPIKVTIQ